MYSYGIYCLCSFSTFFCCWQMLDTSFRGNTCIRLCENNLPEMRKVLLQLNFLLLTLCHGFKLCFLPYLLPFVFFLIFIACVLLVIIYKLENFNFFSALFLILQRALTRFILYVKWRKFHVFFRGWAGHGVAWHGIVTAGFMFQDRMWLQIPHGI